MAQTAAPGAARTRAGAFSLVECLCVVAVLAILIALALPSLAGARAAGRAVVCLSNQRQIGAAWHTYAEDARSFPVGAESNYWQHTRFGWGGVSWFADTVSPGLGLAPDRPLNTYLVGEARVEHPERIFRCPSDQGAALTRTGSRTWEDFGSTTASGEIETCYGVAGTSYEANDWLYCSPGPENSLGWGHVVNGLPELYRTNLAPQSVQVCTSRFVLLGDTGMFLASRYSAQERHDLNLFAGYWHGRELASFTFLDGSARSQRIGPFANGRYTCLMREVPNTYSGWRRTMAP